MKKAEWHQTPSIILLTELARHSKVGAQHFAQGTQLGFMASRDVHETNILIYIHSAFVWSYS